MNPSSKQLQTDLLPNRPLRVLQVYRTYYPETQGGLQEAIRQQARGLRRAGVECDVFTLAKNPEPWHIETPEGDIHRRRSVIEVASCDIGSPQTLIYFRRLAANYDLLNFHYPWPFGDLLALAGAAGKPYVITYHSDIVRQRAAESFYAPLRSYFFAHAKAVVATSQIYALTSPFLLRRQQSVEVIPLGIDPDDIPDVDDALCASWRQRFDKPFFLFVGVLRYYKGLEFLISAARISGAHVVIAGDGPERDRLHEMASGAPNIHFLGHISNEDKFALLSIALGVVFPSHLRAEAFGVTLLEGAISGRALISTEIGTGTSYVNAHGETGLVVPPGDAVALAAAMERMLERPDETQRMGQAARKRCLDLFNTIDVGRRYRDLYFRICNRTVRRNVDGVVLPLEARLGSPVPVHPVLSPGVDASLATPRRAGLR